jgi:hypothetical protein
LSGVICPRDLPIGTWETKGASFPAKKEKLRKTAVAALREFGDGSRQQQSGQAEVCSNANKRKGVRGIRAFEAGKYVLRQKRWGEYGRRLKAAQYYVRFDRVRNPCVRHRRDGRA